MKRYILPLCILLAGCATQQKDTMDSIRKQVSNNTPPLMCAIPTENKRTVKYITIHHTDGIQESAEKAIKKFNQRHKDVLHNKKSCMGYYVAYHYVIGVEGDVVKTRCEYETWNHDPLHNSESIGIALVGQFNSYAPSEKQYIALQKLIDDIMWRYDSVSVITHRNSDEEHPCPGKMFDFARIKGISFLAIK